MRAIAGSGQNGLGLLCLDTGTTERKGEFVPATHGQDGVEQTSWGKNIHGGQTKIGIQGLVYRLGDDLRMTDGVRAVFIHPRLQGGDIHIAYLFILSSHRMQGHRAGSNSKKALAGFQGSDQIEGSQKLRYSGLVVDQSVPVTLPHFDHRVTARSRAICLETVA